VTCRVRLALKEGNYGNTVTSWNGKTISKLEFVKVTIEHYFRVHFVLFKKKTTEIIVVSAENRTALENRNKMIVLVEISQFSKLLSIYLSMALRPFVGPRHLFQFLNLFTLSVGLHTRGISPS
jgi:hypothetical protein